MDETLPRLAVAGTAGDWEGTVGSTLDVVLRVRNDGGAAKGLAVQLWGHALKDPAVRPLSARVGELETPFAALPDKPEVFRAELPDAPVADAASRQDPPPANPSAAGMPGMPTPYDFEVVVRLEAVAPSWTQLFAALVPTANRKTGQAATAVMLSLSAPRTT
jgi:hypothetical protein